MTMSEAVMKMKYTVMLKLDEGEGGGVTNKEINCEDPLTPHLDPLELYNLLHLAIPLLSRTLTLLCSSLTACLTSPSTLPAFLPIPGALLSSPLHLSYADR
ncbi:hypothetical protein Pcinc_032768 [Petrolisthes cinctipes]|uniref:Uncharacterized protein n=1 Tax=Petrolisthes cinctipes TaxID=88211 RepID=A0AAE1K2H6_PETCI|nr:hypothetical protein Pcinc_032768 [Petrolisthes cinctipes]